MGWGGMIVVPAANRAIVCQRSSAYCDKHTILLFRDDYCLPTATQPQVEAADRLGLDLSAGGSDAAVVFGLLDDVVSWVERPNASGLSSAAAPPVRWDAAGRWRLG